MQPILTTPYRVEPFTEDVSGSLSWGLLGNQLLQCAGAHAAQRGFGYDDMIHFNRVWVLARLVIDMKEMPRTGQTYCIGTWVGSVYRQFTDRHFLIQTEDGTPLGHATSTWALIDFTTRQPVDLCTPDFADLQQHICDRPLPIAPPGRIMVREKQPLRTVTAQYSDLDINGHVNSIRYLQMAIDLYGDVIYHDHLALHRVEIAFANESYLGDELQLLTDGMHDDHAQIFIKLPDGKIATKIALGFNASEQ